MNQMNTIERLRWHIKGFFEYNPIGRWCYGLGMILYCISYGIFVMLACQGIGFFIPMIISD